MEDYKQKYEEALERAKGAIKECGDNKGRITMIESIFPELAQSKDERIRKAILELVKQSSHILNPMNQKSMIAWLEKQGKKSNIPQSAEDELRRQHIIQKLEYLRSLDACNQYGKENINKDIAWLEKQSKLEDRGNQDKQHLYDIIAALWDLLDKIDTYADLQINDTNPNNPFRKIENITQERHKFVKSDGYNLFIKNLMITNDNHFEKQGQTKPAVNSPTYGHITRMTGITSTGKWNAEVK